MKWLELEIACPPAAVDAVGFHLTEIGCKGVAIDDPSFVPAKEEVGWDYCDLPDRSGEPTRVRGYVALIGPAWEAALAAADAPDALAGEMAAFERLSAVADLRERLDIMREAVPEWAPLALTLRTVADEDWADAWKAHYHPLRLGRRLFIVPEWEQPAIEPDEVVLRLNPGMAFGTGTHPTTTLCLVLLEELSDKLPAGLAAHQVVDWGTGSGILAVAAARLGATDVLAIDIDPVATEAARENAVSNGVAAPAGPVRVAIGTAVPPGAADLVLANIMADIIIAGAPAVAAGLRPGGHLIASGIIRSRRSDVVATLAAVGLRVERELGEGEWVALLAVRADAAGIGARGADVVSPKEAGR